MNNTIKDKIQHSTTLIYKETLSVMVQFGILTDKQRELLNRICDSFKYGNGKLNYQDIDIFFRYEPELFNKEFLDKVGNPEKYT